MDMKKNLFLNSIFKVEERYKSREREGEIIPWRVILTTIIYAIESGKLKRFYVIPVPLFLASILSLISKISSSKLPE